MPDRLLGILRHQALEFTFGQFVLEMRVPRPGKNSSELRPGVGGAHVDNADRFNSWFGRLDPKQPRRLAALDTAPELPLRGYDEVLIQRVGMGGDLHPFAAPPVITESTADFAATTHILC